MVNCNSLNVQAPTPKPNPQTLVNVPYNTHYRTLTNLQSEKIAQMWRIAKKNSRNPFAKTPIFEQPNQHHTHGYLVLGQVNMHN
jgi:hypothetical protein